MDAKLDMMKNEYFGLACGFHVSPSSCDNPDHYDNYIKFSALSDRNNGMGVTHVVLNVGSLEEKPTAIMGYVSIRATSLVSTSERGTKTVHPALEIAELAVSGDYERNGVGKILVNIAICIADDLRSDYLGIKYVVLCADPRAVGFYEKQGFKKINDIFETLRDGYNDNCVPMYIQLPELNNTI